MVLTPSCDLVTSGERNAKVSQVLVARCGSIKDLLGRTRFKEIKMNSKGKEQIRTSVLAPGFFETIIPFPRFSGHIPTMGTDMRDLELIPLTDIGARKPFLRIASIDSPFRELISWAYLQVAGRPGLPDRNLCSWVKEITEAWSNASSGSDT